MLTSHDAVLVVVDVQGKLAGLMHEAPALFDALSRLVRGAKVLGIPVIATEQNPTGLGPTIDELAPHLPGPIIPKMAFSCCGEPSFVEALQATERTQVLLAGIETHVCVYQTAQDLLADGWEVHLVVDAISSRTAGNREIGLAKMQALGAEITSVEMALFEMLTVAKGPEFKEILNIVK